MGRPIDLYELAHNNPHVRRYLSAWEHGAIMFDVMLRDLINSLRQINAETHEKITAKFTEEQRASMIAPNILDYKPYSMPDKYTAISFEDAQSQMIDEVIYQAEIYANLKRVEYDVLEFEYLHQGKMIAWAEMLEIAERQAVERQAAALHAEWGKNGT